MASYAQSAMIFLQALSYFAAISLPFIAIAALNTWRPQKHHETALKIIEASSRFIRGMQFQIPSLIEEVLKDGGLNDEWFSKHTKNIFESLGDMDVEITLAQEVLNDQRIVSFIKNTLSEVYSVHGVLTRLRIEYILDNHESEKVAEYSDFLKQMHVKWNEDYCEAKLKEIGRLVRPYL